MSVKSLTNANGEHTKYIQKQMGHSSIQATMDIYGHLMKGTNTQAAEKLAAFALGGSKMVANRSKEGQVKVQKATKEPLRNNYHKSARHARIILSGIQIFKNLDSRYKLAGMTYYLGRGNNILF